MAVVPVILCNSGSGSDTAASGAGPASALSGTGASLNATSTVDLSADTPDLSGVATDGTAALWVDTTSGRQWGRITAVDDGLDTVTVHAAYGVTESARNWGIGGKRATLAEKVLSGDGEAGWIVELESGFTQTFSATVTIASALIGTEANGRTILRGAEGAATTPVLTFSNNGTAIDCLAAFASVENIDFRNTNATKTASVAVAAGGFIMCRNLRIEHATNNFYRGISINGGYYIMIDSCSIGETADHGLYASDRVPSVTNSEFHDCGGSGIYCLDTGSGHNAGSIVGCVFDGNADGLRLFDAGNRGTTIYSAAAIVGNTFHNNTGAGIRIDNSTRAIPAQIVGNVFTSNGYGIDDGGAFTDEAFLMGPCLIASNLFGTGATANTSKYRPSDLTTFDDTDADPGYTAAGSRDYTVGTNAKAVGHPFNNLIGFEGPTATYVDAGAAQRQEAAAGVTYIRRTQDALIGR